MSKLTITIENEDQRQVILAALESAEENGEIDFTFNCQSDEEE